MAWCFNGGDYYETNVIYWLEKVVRLLPNPTIYDVGSNFGYYAVTCAGYAEKVYAFEPVPETFNILAKNISQNQVPNVLAFNTGLAEEAGNATINLYNSCVCNSLYVRELDDNHSLKKTGEAIISLDALDHFVRNHSLNPPDLIKIDIEGAELSMLKGATKTIAAHRPVIFIEYSHNTAKDAGYREDAIVEELSKYGYVLYGLSSDDAVLDLITFENLNADSVANLIAVPPYLSEKIELMR